MVVFMKGVPDAPQCGFSNTVTQAHGLPWLGLGLRVRLQQHGHAGMHGLPDDVGLALASLIRPRPTVTFTFASAFTLIVTLTLT